MNFEAIFHFFNSSSIITYIVLLWLSLYFILAFSILFARLTYLATWRNKEKESLETLLLGEKDLSRTDSILRKCNDTTSNHLEIYKNLASRRASAGLTWLSIIASTSPFILGKLGLRVIKLLFANAKLEQNTSVKTNLQKNLRILYPWLNKIFKDNFI